MHVHLFHLITNEIVTQEGFGRDLGTIGYFSYHDHEWTLHNNLTSSLVTRPIWKHSCMTSVTCIMSIYAWYLIILHIAITFTLTRTSHAPSSTMHIGGRSFIIHQRRVGVSYSTLAIICQKLLACPRTPLFWQTKVLCPCMGPLSTRLQYTLSSNVLITVYSTHLHVPTMPCRHAMFSKSNH